MASKRKHVPPKKGKEIRFVRGTYAGRTGWVNDAKKTRGKSCPVIVKLDDEEKETTVWRRSYRKPFSKPANREEAAIQQHPDIELAMIKLFQMFAECDLRSNQNVIHLLNKEFTDAKKHQRDLNGKARYRRVEYNSQDDVVMA